MPTAPNVSLSLRGEGEEEILQRQQPIQGRREVVSAGHRFGKTQHRVALTVGITEHTQQLLFNIVQTRAVGAKVEAVSTAGGTVRQALTHNLQPFPFFF